jgi:hypothetical protein
LPLPKVPRVLRYDLVELPVKPLAGFPITPFEGVGHRVANRADLLVELLLHGVADIGGRGRTGRGEGQHPQHGQQHKSKGPLRAGCEFDNRHD